MRLFFLFIVLTSTFATAQNKSSIIFEIRNLGINVDGHFNTYKIITNFNPEGELLNLQGEIEVSSIKTGTENRDEHLLKEDYFHATKHKLIRLKSQRIQKLSNTKYQVEATLNIKGKSKQIIFPVKVEKQPNKFKITSNFEINRKDFDVGGSSFILSKTVKVNVVHFENL